VCSKSVSLMNMMLDSAAASITLQQACHPQAKK
jgi:hypothetical protein